MLRMFKPSWIVIEVVHERYTFDTYYTYCSHKTLKELESMFMLDEDVKEDYKDGSYIYDSCGERWEGDYVAQDEDSRNIKLHSYGINYTIVIPAKKKKKDQYFIAGHTHNKFGLFDREYISETSTDE